MLADVLLGYVISRVLDKKSPTARPPIVVTPTTPTAPTTPIYTPPTPTPTVTPTVTPAAPPFPSGQIVPASNVTPAAGMKKAVEVWVVKPELQTVIVGMRLNGATTATTLSALESSFPQGWQAAKVVTAAEITTAKSLLPKWKEGGVIFMGPATLAGRRAYRMTKHPATATQPAAVPVAAPAAPAAPTPAPSGIVPASYTPPVATPAPTAVPSAPKPPAAAPSPPQVKPPAATAAPMPATGLTPQVTTVRRGEGLANIAKRLGMPATATSAAVIQKANVPRGPDATWKAIAMTKGGLQKSGRNAGLQPGDRLWVPSTWGPYSASQL